MRGGGEAIAAITEQIRALLPHACSGLLACGQGGTGVPTTGALGPSAGADLYVVPAGAGQSRVSGD